MRFLIVIALCTIFSLGSTTPAEAQIGRTISKGIKWFGKTAAGAAVGEGVKYAFQRAFQENNRRSIQISITNNYRSSYTYFWVTQDGVNWTKYSLAPGYYLTAYSGSSGYVGVYTANQYYVLNQQGNYAASQFY